MRHNRGRRRRLYSGAACAGILRVAAAERRTTPLEVPLRQRYGD